MKKFYTFIIVLISSFTVASQSTDEVFKAGSYIIDMGDLTADYEKSTEHYGLVYELIIDHNVPVKWAINQSKTFDGVDFTANTVSVGSKDFSGGPFIIQAEFVPSNMATILSTNWPNAEVFVAADPFIAPVFEELSSFPRMMFDVGNSGISDGFLNNAGIPLTIRDTGVGADADQCYDIFVLPHADPDYAQYRDLIGFNANYAGYIWSACHAVSVLENIDDPLDKFGLPDLNFLTTNGLVDFQTPGHADGSAGDFDRYAPTNPVMQFMGRIDDATRGGSEQIYLSSDALGSVWRSTTTILVEDPNHVDIIGGTSGNDYTAEPAVVMAVGPGFGDSNNGLVMYEGGHNVAGENAEGIAAQRAFYNFAMLKTGIDKRLNVDENIAEFSFSGTSIPVEGTVITGEAPFTYAWSSDCGGSFTNSSSSDATFNPPAAPGSNFGCKIVLTVTDACGRKNIVATAMTINPDFDGDGILDDDDFDDNNNGIPDRDESAGINPSADADNDGIPNFMDADYVHPTLGPFVDSNSDGINDLFDNDLDGVANQFDLDSDNDGIPDAVEANGGTLPANMDSDGKYTTAYASGNDADGDGLVDDTDTTQGGTKFTNPDTDGDGISDLEDLDSDGDGIPDAVEANGGSLPANMDADGKYTLSYIQINDFDFDGIPNDIDPDNAGTALAITNSDTDPSGTSPDYLDVDSDNDGIVDNIEAQTIAGFVALSGNDTDGDGIDDSYDPDNGGTAMAYNDQDGTGGPDYIDTDSDGDTIPDIVEGHDADGDGDPADNVLAGTDADGDGLDDNFDPDVISCSYTHLGQPSNGGCAYLGNTDGTDQPDWRDTDDDNDGTLTIAESTPPDYISIDSDGDGIPNRIDLDDDNDGITDAVELGGDPFKDTDGDGIIDSIDLDSDGDGFPDGIEANNGIIAAGMDANGQYPAAGADDDGDGLTNSQDPDHGSYAPLDDGDVDGDGLPNRVDLDADGDGIFDVRESDGTDADNDGQLDATADADGNGLDDSVDIGSGGSALALTNTDVVSEVGAIKPNFLDIDADADGIIDNIEAQSTAGYIAPSGNDTDGDGVDDAYDIDNGGTPITPVRTVDDGSDDYRDTDTDDDGVPDSIEGHDANIDGVADITAGANDVDNDGLNDAFDPDFIACTNSFNGQPANGGCAAIQNTDGRDEADWRDTDDDNDGNLTSAEDSPIGGCAAIGPGNGDFSDDFCEGGTSPDYLNVDSDGDGIANDLDLDDDNDGIPDTVEGYADTDGDGIYDYIDLDSDGDGLPDAVEANGGTLPADMNAQGQYPAGLFPAGDANGDGLHDNVDSASGGTALDNPDTDGDGINDFQDIDSDGDGIIDNIEIQANGAYIAPSGVDTDQDGIDDAYDPDCTPCGGVTGATLSPIDTDSDGTSNYLDTDSDGDGISDLVEGHDADGDGVANVTPSGVDADGDGLDDAFDPDFIACSNTDLGQSGNGGCAGLQDTDGDGTFDYTDNDDDGDGIATISESGDSDGNGTPDYLDEHSVNCNPGEVQLTITDYAEAQSDAGAGVTDAGNIIGAFDGAFAFIPDLESIVIDFGEVIPAGYGIEIQVSDAGAKVDVENSYDKVAFSDLVQDVPNFGLDFSRFYTLAIDSRYLRIAADGDISVDGAYFEITECFSDVDGDGTRDLDDIDNDNDGIPDITEGLGENPMGDDDGDNVPNYLDPDYAHGSFVACTDGNADGTCEATTWDTDGDGIANHLDLDSDNDGIPDAVEANGGTLPANMTANGQFIAGYVGANDTDGDGLPNVLDSDNGGTALTNPDTDSDGLANFLDLDSDNDGITDATEAGGTDANGDGVIDSFTDSDGDGLHDGFDIDQGGTALTVSDQDGDGTVNYLDSDSDGDGIPDIVEGHDGDDDGYGDWDANTDHTLDVVEGNADTDGDGILDAFDPDCATCGGVTGTTASLNNSDYDSLPDYLDADDDGDGIPTANEDTDMNGNWADDLNQDPGATTPDYKYQITDHDGDTFDDDVDPDSDNDGIPDSAEDAGTGFDPSADEDGDLIPNWADQDEVAVGFPAFIDTNNDGINDAFDTDLDGLPDHIDRDSDNDGVPDIIEAGGTDSDGDGEIDSFTDTTPADGQDDTIAGSPLPLPDTDGDGLPDYRDLDSDGDGIADVLETGGTDADGDGQLDSFVDTDGDGLNDAVDTDNGGTATTVLNTDGDTNGSGNPIYDYIDLDSDGDGITDAIEAQSVSGYIAPSGSDTDGDGLDNAYDTDNGGTYINPLNTDGTGNPDFQDTDSDGDGVSDLIESNDADMDGVADSSPSGADADFDGLDDAFDPDCTPCGANGTPPGLQNTDGADNPDWRDTDDDNDGLPTSFEDTNDNNNWSDDFTQGGGAVPNYLFALIDHDGDGFDDDNDADADNDGISNTDEGLGVDPSADADIDGIPNYLDPDFVHPTEGAFVDSNGDGVNDIFDADLDGLPNHIDRDSDNDGLTDTFEATGTDATGDGIIDGLVDSGPADGVNDGGLTTPVDSDGDGIADFLDRDSDDDGLTDILEAGGTDADGDGMIDFFADNDADGLHNGIDPDNAGTPLSPPNTDSDGVADYLDIDSDNDGIVDNIEGRPLSTYSPPSGFDSDGDGIDNAYDVDCAPCGFVTGVAQITATNTDGDALPDYLDADSDNDGVSDIIEGNDNDGDGVANNTPAGTDADGDGLDDNFDTVSGPVASDNSVGSNAGVQNTDGDDFQDFRDSDDDGDLIATVNEDFNNNNDWSDDFTQGGTSPDYLHVKSESCGTYFITVTGNGDVGIAEGLPFDDGKVQNPTFAEGAPDNNGGDEALISARIQGGGRLRLDMTDIIPEGETVSITIAGDGVGKTADITSSLDGSTDGGLFSYSSTADAKNNQEFEVISYTVPAGGARYIHIERTNGNIYVDGISYLFCLPDQDLDGVEDKDDVDDDNDGILDVDEDVAETINPSGDEDGDGILNYQDDSDATVTAGLTSTADSNGDGIYDVFDTDLDGIPNHMDLDADNDGIPDAIEANSGTLPSNMSTDGQFLTGYAQNNDADGDGLVDDVDPSCAPCGANGTALANPDTDNGTGFDDGLKDFLDRDSDNDGITDAEEAGGIDANGDGIIDSFTDADGDGLNDAQDLSISGIPLTIPDTDGILGPNYIDIESDSDGVPDILEGHDSDTNDIGDWDSNSSGTLDFAEGNADADGDGILDAFDPDCAPCGSVTGRAAPLQDRDGDGLADYVDSQNNVPLPVVLVYFHASLQGEWVELNWRTATELNNDYFLVEKSLDGKAWETVTIVNGAGTTDAPHDYRAEDRDMTPGIRYYRLTQYDFDGAFETFEVKVVNVPFSALKVEVYPNPASEILKIRSNQQGTLKYSLYDLEGRELMNSHYDGYLEIPIYRLRDGMYFIHLQSGSEKIIRKIIKQ